MKLSQIAQDIGASIVYPADTRDLDIKGVAPIDRADVGYLSFIANPEYAKFAMTTKASALLVRAEVEGCAAIQLIHSDPYACFAKVAQHFHKPPHPQPGIASSAVIDKSATVGSNATIGPNVVVGARAKLGAGVVIYSGVHIGDDVVIGDNTVIYANCVIYYGCRIGKDCIIHAGSVIGADGFGYAVTATETIKIPQVGIVIIGDDVEIGALCTVDRAAMGATKIGRGTKLDSRVQIAHNCETGERCMFSAFSGLAGSAKIGDRVTLGGYAGVTGHATVVSNTRIGAMTGVISSLDEAGDYVGFPAVKASQWRRTQVHIRKLDSYEKRIKQLEQALAKLTAKE